LGVMLKSFWGHFGVILGTNESKTTNAKSQKTIADRTRRQNTPRRKPRRTQRKSRQQRADPTTKPQKNRDEETTGCRRITATLLRGQAPPKPQDSGWVPALKLWPNDGALLGHSLAEARCLCAGAGPRLEHQLHRRLSRPPPWPQSRTRGVLLDPDRLRELLPRRAET